MHKFAFYLPTGSSPPDLASAYLVGSDGVPVRAELSLSGSTIVCNSRNPDALGLSLLWPVSEFGVVQLETTRLPPRDEPYHLHIELCRHRLMRISLKREEWGLFDYPGMEQIAERLDQARDLFIQALQTADDPRAAARLADQALSHAVWASEQMCLFHAAVFLSRRQQGGGFSHGYLGVALGSGTPRVALNGRLGELFDFVRVPFVWREIQPKEQGAEYDTIDNWLKLCAKSNLAVRGGPLLNFGVQFVPDWMYLWENDYEAVVDFAREHIRRTTQRYKTKITHWVVASGLHADNVFVFNFEQIMDLTRMAAITIRQNVPRCQLVLDLTQPWGEYYARNQRTVPPLLYAEMAVQSAVPFDAFGLQFLLGLDSEGFRVRDLLQVSTLIDRLANLGKPLHITAVGVPSKSGAGGLWRAPWSDQVQADWFTSFAEIALSRPYVESICISSLTDSADRGIPYSGVLREDLTPKSAFHRLAELRRRLAPESRPAT